MSSTDPDKLFSFTLKKIHLIEKSLNLINSGGKEEFTFDISLQITSNRDIKESIHIMHVLINTKKDGAKAGLIKLACSFFIPNYEEYILEDDTNASLPKDLLYLLNTVVIGTMRGVMFSEFRGTVLNNAYLPVLDPRGFEKVEGK